jgi:hypothetical protein
MVGRAKRAGRDPRRAGAGEAGDAVNTRGFNGLGEGHRRQDGGESAGQHRLARPWGTKEEDVVVRMPAFGSALPACLEGVPEWWPLVAAIGSLMAGSGIGAASGQLIKESLGLLEVGSINALGEPVVDGCQQRMGFGEFALLLPQAGQAHGRP